MSVKTTDDGKYLCSRLEDRGILIYELKEKNPLSYGGKKLKNVEISLFHLNTASKQFFTKHMGVIPRVFGSIFLYKNGFRTHPFGELGDDSLGIDSRKTQGYARFLGNRDLIGRIEIGDNEDFQETSSRDGGLIKNEAYSCLKEMFLTFCLKRLERYAVEIVKFGNFSETFEEQFSEEAEIKAKIISLIESLTQSEEIIDIKFDPNIVNVLTELSEKSLQKLIKNLGRIAEENDNKELAGEAKKAEKRLAMIVKAKIEAEKEAEVEKKNRKKAEAEAEMAGEEVKAAEKETQQIKSAFEEKTTQNIFLQSVVSQDIVNVVNRALV